MSSVRGCYGSRFGNHALSEIHQSFWQLCLCYVYEQISDKWGTYRDDHTSHLSYVRTFSSHLTVTVIIGKSLLASIFSFTFKPKILQSFISSQLTTWLCHDSQKTSMPPTNRSISVTYASVETLCIW